MDLCENCFADKLLCDFVHTSPNLTDKCLICGASNVKIIDCTNAKNQQVVKAVIRYHFGEYKYNQHFGGDRLSSFLVKSVEIFSAKAINNSELLSEAIEELIENVYEDYDAGISLFGGYCEGEQLPLLRALKLSVSPRLSNLDQKSEQLNYYEYESDIDAILRDLRPHIEKTISHLSLFRARIGFKLGKYPDDDWESEPHYIPYEAGEISAPPPQLSRKGRLNREFVSFLYLADDIPIAVAEIKPSPGEYVSVGEFKLKRSLLIADFTNIDFIDFASCDKMLDLFELKNSINNLFSTPIPTSKQHRYLLTQAIADRIRVLGFEGIAFNSSVAEGVNYLLFDTQSAEYVVDSGKTLLIRKVEVDYLELRKATNRDDYLYDIDPQNGRPII